MHALRDLLSPLCKKRSLYNLGFPPRVIGNCSQGVLKGRQYPNMPPRLPQGVPLTANGITERPLQSRYKRNVGPSRPVSSESFPPPIPACDPEFIKRKIRPGNRQVPIPSVNRLKASIVYNHRCFLKTASGQQPSSRSDSG